MKKILISIASFFSVIIHGCPTCVGKVTAQTVPFFAEEFYKPGKQDNNCQLSASQYGKKELQKLIDDHKGKK